MAIKNTYLGGTDWTNGEVLDADDLNDTIDECAKYPIVLLGTGNVTLQNTTTSFDTDYADVSISASQLTATDMIKIEIVGYDLDSSRQVQLQIEAKSTSSDGAIISTYTITDTPTAIFRGVICLVQDVTNNDWILGTITDHYSTTPGVGTGYRDTNDANIFTTAFDIRINLKYNAAATNDSTITYIAYAIRS